MSRSVSKVDGDSASTSSPSEYLVSVHVQEHRYGNTVALSECNLDIRPGEIHGLVGENGSGKSTTVKLLSGIIQPTNGDIYIDGVQTKLVSPRSAQAQGISTVFQETLVCEGNSAIENVFIGTDGVFRKHTRERNELSAAEAVAERLGVGSGVLRQPMHALSIADRQVITLIRALVRPWKLLILDEATSALDIETRDNLFRLIREHREQGRSVLFVSHRMDELEILIDRATVQRSGKSVGVVEKSDAAPERLVAMMSGQTELADYVHQVGERVPSHTKVQLVAEDVRIGPDSDSFSLEVRAGEILGVAGLEGQGGNQIVEALAGIRRASSGRVRIADKPTASSFRSYREAFASGVCYVPAKRQEEGLFAPLTVAQNFIVATVSRLSVLGFFRKKRTDTATWEYMDILSVRPRSISIPVSELSGGNAQKILIGRWLAARPSVLILNDPLRGVDIGTKRQFYRLLGELANEGVAIVMLSTEIEELLLISDRIAVCRNSSVFRTLTGASRTQDAVLAAMFGLQDADSNSEGAGN